MYDMDFQSMVMYVASKTPPLPTYGIQRNKDEKDSKEWRINTQCQCVQRECIATFSLASSRLSYVFLCYVFLLPSIKCSRWP